MNEFRKAFAGGYECIAAWSELIDRINVFPVADGDTGSNLRISLAPLLNLSAGQDAAVTQLGRCAIGNSGNIAAPFFKEFVQVMKPADLPARAALGRDKAWQAVAEPRSGTMLSVFETLANTLEQDGEVCYSRLSDDLRQTVLDGARMLPELAKAGVVDAGALAMFIFFDGFFRQLTGQKEIFAPVLTLFAGKLSLNRDFQAIDQNSYCVDAVIYTEGDPARVREALSRLGESVVVATDNNWLKVHVHTPEPAQLHKHLSSLGKVSSWSDATIDERAAVQLSESGERRVIHLVSDAAGSLTRDLASQNSITLLDSYIITDGCPRPESLFSPGDLYNMMRTGSKVTTAQASNFERHQHYESICRQYGRALYLCVGSAFTGNYDAVMAWKRKNDPDDQLEVLDTGAASGRLGLIALLTARYAENEISENAVIGFARKMMTDCREYVFIDELKYLVAGGRVSKASGFFGNLLNMKPVISPTRDGVEKVGVVHSRKGQLDFALEKLEVQFHQKDNPVLMLQYSDNKEWVAGMVQQQIKELLPLAEILLVPLSLTSGVHMGPGTWSLAFTRTG